MLYTMHAVLVQLLTQQRIMQKKLKPVWVKYKQIDSLLNEHATIHLGAHRQSGHSTAAALLAKSEADLYGTVLICVPLAEQVKRFTDEGLLAVQRDKANTVIHPESVLGPRLIVIDGTYAWKPSAKKRFLEWAGHIVKENLELEMPSSIIFLQ